MNGCLFTFPQEKLHTEYIEFQNMIWPSPLGHSFHCPFSLGLALYQHYWCAQLLVVLLLLSVHSDLCVHELIQCLSYMMESKLVRWPWCGVWALYFLGSVLYLRKSLCYLSVEAAHAMFSTEPWSTVVILWEVPEAIQGNIHSWEPRDQAVYSTLGTDPMPSGQRINSTPACATLRPEIGLGECEYALD